MKNEIMKTLKDLLSFKTYAENEDEFTKLFNYIKENYKELNITEYEFNNKKCLALSNTTSKDVDLLFCTHIDVVYAEDYSITEDDENIYGRGTIDMKGSVAVVLTIMKHLQTKAKVTLLITSDEELTGACASELSKIYTSRFVIVPDGGTNFELIVEEKGLIQLELSTKTKAAHAAQLFNGENAITKLIDVYQKIIEKYPLPKSADDFITSINLSKLNGGVSNNQVPDYATMVLDIRNIASDKSEDIINFIKSISKDVEVKLITEGPTFSTDLTSEYVKKYIASCEKVLGTKVIQKGCESTSDAIFFADKNMPTVIMNPNGYYAHSPKEYVNKESLYTLYKIYEDFIGGNYDKQ